MASNLALVSDRRRGAVFAVDLDNKAASEAFGGFTEPAGISETPGGGYVVADRGAHQIVVVDDIAGSNPESFGTHGTGINEFTHPLDAGVTPAGELLIADAGNHRLVQVDDPSGTNWTAFGTEGRPSPADPAVGKFDSPTSIIGLADGSIVAADPGGGRVITISSIDGADWTSFGLSTTEATTLNAPVGVSADAASVYVSELGARRVSLYPSFPAEPPERIADAVWDVLPHAPSALSAFGSDGLLVLDAALARLVEIHQQAGAWQITASVSLRRVGVEEPTGVCKVTA